MNSGREIWYHQRFTSRLQAARTAAAKTATTAAGTARIGTTNKTNRALSEPDTQGMISLVFLTILWNFLKCLRKVRKIRKIIKEKYSSKQEFITE